jgi:hypothetical protein
MRQTAIRAMRLALLAAMARALLIAPIVNAQPEGATDGGVPATASELAIRELLSQTRGSGDTSAEAVAPEEFGELLRSSGQGAEAAEAFQDAARVLARARQPLREFIALTAAGPFLAARAPNMKRSVLDSNGSPMGCCANPGKQLLHPIWRD